jgi:hypothetical protein
MTRYTIKALKKANAIVEWEISHLSEKEAATEAVAEAAANPELNIFVVFADGYLNIDGHSPVGKKW